MAKYRPSTLDDFDVTRRARDEQRRAVDASAMPTGSNVYATTEKVQNLDLGDLVTRVGDLETGKQDKLTAGANVQISSGSVISATDTTYTAGANVQISGNNEISATDTTYSNATQSTAGLMSSTDKTKLDGIAAGAQVNEPLPVGTMLIMKTNNAPSLTGTWTLVTGFHLPMTNSSSTTYYLFERTA